MQELTILREALSVCQIPPTSELPGWVLNTEFYAITKTYDELSIVCSSAMVPVDIKAEHGWRAMKVVGQLDFSLTGVLDSMAHPLAKAGISIFAFSTYDTDYILIKEEQLEAAKNVLISHKHCFV